MTRGADERGVSDKARALVRTLTQESCGYGQALVADDGTRPAMDQRDLADRATGAVLDYIARLETRDSILRQMANAVYNANQNPALWDRAKVALTELQTQLDALTLAGETK